MFPYPLRFVWLNYASALGETLARSAPERPRSSGVRSFDEARATCRRFDGADVADGTGEPGTKMCDGIALTEIGASALTHPVTANTAIETSRLHRVKCGYVLDPESKTTTGHHNDPGEK